MRTIRLAPLHTIHPEPLVGFGSNTTGGRGGRFVRVTNLSTGVTSGSFLWALAQHPGEPLYIAICVEGGIQLLSHTTITRPNLTIDFRYAPGNGAWLYGKRLALAASNIFIDNLIHFGNDATPDQSSDCMGNGIYSTDPSDTEVMENIYYRRCEFHYGRDEVFSITSRANDQSTGNVARNITVQNVIVANPCLAAHEFGTFIGDGTQRTTFDGFLSFNCDARLPFIREYIDDVEVFNFGAYNFNQNCIAITGDADVSVRGGLLRMGPRWKNIRAPIQIDSGARPCYVDDILIDSKIGKINAWGVTRGGTPAAAQPFAGSGAVVLPSAAVEARLLADLGARRYGGGIGSVAATVLGQFSAGDAPASLQSFPGAVPTASGASYPAHKAGVPDAYRDIYRADTNPEAIIADGGDWSGHMVAERIGAWHIRGNVS